MTEYRPHCAKPAACAAKGPRHCRSCACRALVLAQAADPAFVHRRSSAGGRATAANPAHRKSCSERLKALNADPSFQAKLVAGQMRPEARARVSKAVRAANLARHAAHLLTLGLLPSEFDQYRAVRAKGLSSPEAAALVIRSRGAAE